MRKPSKKAKAPAASAPEQTGADVDAIAIRINAEERVTRAEAEIVVRANQRKCLGPFKGMSERTLRDLVRTLREEALSEPELRGAAEVVEAAGKQGADAGAIIAALQKKHTRAAGRANVLLRAGCGQDVNDLLLAAPLDGDTHEYRCPKCDNVATHRAPFIQIAERTRKGR